MQKLHSIKYIVVLAWGAGANALLPSAHPLATPLLKMVENSKAFIENYCIERFKRGNQTPLYLIYNHFHSKNRACVRVHKNYGPVGWIFSKINL